MKESQNIFPDTININEIIKTKNDAPNDLLHEQTLELIINEG